MTAEEYFVSTFCNRSHSKKIFNSAFLIVSSNHLYFSSWRKSVCSHWIWSLLKTLFSISHDFNKLLLILIFFGYFNFLICCIRFLFVLLFLAITLLTVLSFSFASLSFLFNFEFPFHCHRLIWMLLQWYHWTELWIFYGIYSTYICICVTSFNVFERSVTDVLKSFGLPIGSDFFY